MIYDGNINDTTNFTTNKFLQINSCGFQNTSSDFCVVRKKGRLDYHILLIDSGMCEVLHNGILYTLNAGNLVLYAPHEEQKYTIKSGSTTLWCHFTGTAVNEILQSCNITSGVYFFNQRKGISEAYAELIKRFHIPGRKDFANASFLELIYNIKDAQLFQNINEEKHDLLQPVLTYINMNYDKPITVDMLAKQLGYSKSRFSHIFSETMGTTPIKHINDIRLNSACEMLSSTNLSISTIAFNCGFNDPLYFSKLFFKKYKTTPSEYRKSH